MFKNQKTSVQADQKFSATYYDDWDNPPQEWPANGPGQVEPALAPRESLTTRASTASLPSPPSAAKSPAAKGERPNPRAASMPTPAPVPIPMPHKLERFPGLLARSAIFRIGRADEGIERCEVACYGAGYEAVYEGPRLCMRDKSVWECALRAAKEHGFAGDEIALPTTAIAAAIGGGDSGPALARIGESLLRLSKARIQYSLPGGVRGCAALLGSARKTASGWRVAFDNGIVPLLADDKQFEIDTHRRSQLSSDLAKWAHDFMSTHKAGYEGGFRLGELARLCGWRGDSGQFPSRLSAALAELAKQCPELVKGFQVERGRRSSSTWRVRVDKGPESECFEVPAKKARPAKPAGPRRGGVSL